VNGIELQGTALLVTGTTGDMGSAFAHAICRSRGGSGPDEPNGAPAGYAAPFGVKDSRYGCEGVREGIMEFVSVKNVAVALARSSSRREQWTSAGGEADPSSSTTVTARSAARTVEKWSSSLPASIGRSFGGSDHARQIGGLETVDADAGLTLITDLAVAQETPAIRHGERAAGLLFDQQHSEILLVRGFAERAEQSVDHQRSQPE
jgi:hypothetical protein